MASLMGVSARPKISQMVTQIKYLRNEAATRAHQSSLVEALLLWSGLWPKKKALNIWAAGRKAKKTMTACVMDASVIRSGWSLSARVLFAGGR